MVRAGARLHHGLRWGALGLAALLVTSAASGQAQARARHHHRHRSHHVSHHASRYNPPYASIIVDVNSGKVLQETNADSPRHPASLSKMMTLYLLFEWLQEGKIHLSSEMEVSAHASAMAPSKLGLKPGQTITVENAIKAIVTKSANDVAVVVAEKLGGTELGFAHMMTAKAHALGMSHTNYHNASGLPDDLQITTARDQAILARALQDRFPKFFRYFSTRAFVWNGHRMRNHNHLLGKVDGVDGIKTGYIRDSGFNIAVDVRRKGHHVVAVVFGGHSARARDAQVRKLIDQEIKTASTRRTAPLVVEGWRTHIAAAAPTPAKDPREADLVRASEPATARPAPGSAAPIKPHPVRTVTVRPGKRQFAALSPLPSNSRKIEPAPSNSGTITTVATVKRVALPPRPPDAKPAAITLSAQVASAGDADDSAADDAKPHSGWMIQIGAFDNEHEAKLRLAAAKKKASEQLGEADSFTERIAKGDKSLYRARFAGLDKPQAEQACKHLKRSDIPCFVLKN
jgi:D-alanyl-D-alanine carboxypeptidase